MLTVRPTSRLLGPGVGARPKRPPRLRWKRSPKARYYNVQLYRGKRKVLSAWPRRTRLQLHSAWRYGGRWQRLAPGTYRWYVWPGYGHARRAAIRPRARHANVHDPLTAQASSLDSAPVRAIAITCLALMAGLAAAGCGDDDTVKGPSPQAPATIQVRSPAFSEGGAIPAVFTCEGQNVSPPIAWHGLPPSTKSVALLMEDPDAPSGTFVHWSLFNIPRYGVGVYAGQLPVGARQGKNSFGKDGYGGPCPPTRRSGAPLRLLGLRAARAARARPWRSARDGARRDRQAGRRARHSDGQVRPLSRGYTAKALRP